MELWRYADKSQMGWQHPLEKKRIEVEKADPLSSQLRHFCRVVRGEEEPLVGGRDAALSLAAALAVLESAEILAPVDIPVPYSR